MCEYTKEIALAEQKRVQTPFTLFKEALKKKEFQIYFQPKISGREQKITSAEVLVRWQRANGDLWFPDSFLPILEETEIEALDYCVFMKQHSSGWQTDEEKGLNCCLFP